MWCPSDLQMEGFPYFKRFKWNRVFFLGRLFFGERRNLLCEKKPSEGEAIFLKKEKAGRGYKEISSIFGWLV